MKLEAKIRKEESMLNCSGLSVILFGIWSIIRAFLMEYVDPAGFSKIIDMANDVEDAGPDTFLLTDNIFFIILLVCLSFDLLIRLYIGLSAIKEAKGRIKKIPIYLLISLVYAYVAYTGNISSIGAVLSGELEPDNIFYPIIDMSTNIALIMILISAIKLRLLKSKYNDLMEQV